MSTENQFLSWLQRPEKSFSENLQFALKAMKSSEFTLMSKYEISLNWITEEGAKLCKQNLLPTKEVGEILQIRAQPALIRIETKKKFAEMLLEHANAEKKPTTRLYSELIQKLISVEWMQDLIRSNYKITALLFATLCQCYERYLNAETESKQPQLTAHETTFCASIVSLLKEHIKFASNIHYWLKAYDKHVLQPLAQLLLLLRSKFGIDFFEDLREIENSLRKHHNKFISNMDFQPTHSALLAIECAVANRRMDQELLLRVFEHVFPNVFQKDSSKEISLSLTKVAYVLDVFRKHNVVLNFQVNEKSALSFLGGRIHEYVRSYKDTHLREVLLILCESLRLNPLILENHIFELTVWMIMAPKNNSIESESQAYTYSLFEEYLALLLDMFRRLSRAEKFVVNLLKALKQWLNENQSLPSLPTTPKSKNRLKRKLEQSPLSSEKRSKLEDGTTEELDNSNEVYINMLFEDFNKQMKTSNQLLAPSELQESFPYLQYAWPSATIGYAFSRLITGLVAKASLTIGKTLLYALKEQLELLATQGDALDAENASFRLDFHAAILCQFYTGARPTEQYEKYKTEITQLRQLSKEILTKFGQFIIERNYQRREANAFLECCFYASNFELLLGYYKPDGLVDESLECSVLVPQLHAFLTPQQWSTLQENVTNHGKSNCRKLFGRLLLQRIEAEKLLHTTDAYSLNEQSNTLKLLGNKSDATNFASILKNSMHVNWLLGQMSRTEKFKMLKQQIPNISTIVGNDIIEVVSENAESLELLIYIIFDHLQTSLSEICKSSLLGCLNCDFKSVRNCSPQDHQEFDKIIKSNVKVINTNPNVYKLKNFPTEEIGPLITTIHQLPTGHLRRQVKSLIFTFFVALYQDLRMTQADVEGRQLLECLTDLLHFGQQVPIFRYFEMTKILELLPIADCWEFYEFLFSTIKNEEKGTEEFLKLLQQLLGDALKTTKTLNSDERRLLLIAVETLSNLGGLVGRRMNRHLYSLLSVYGDYVYGHFENDLGSKKDKKFVEKTLGGFAPFLSAVLTATNKNNETVEINDEKQSRQPLKTIDEEFRRICKIYIGHSMDYRNPQAIRLIQVALNNRKLLHLDQDEIELLLTGYWRQLNGDLAQETTAIIAPKTSETLMKIIIDNKSNEDLLLTLREIGVNMKTAQNFGNVIELITLIAKCTFSTIKGAIFNEEFKQLTNCIILRLQRSEQHQFVNQSILLKLLTCQQACVKNRTIPITPDTLDAMLSFLVDINIKKFSISDTNSTEFFALHIAMTSLCDALIKQRHILLMDRIPQFLHVFKDLLQAIVLYKSERQKDTSLSSDEVHELSELALKLEVLMHTIATHSTDFKRVAPFVLIFAINLMVSGKRPTTLYPKIKTHIEAICYSLIGICDHRVGRFILRCSNEAARQTYELLVKEHKKYHKFKGKI